MSEKASLQKAEQTLEAAQPRRYAAYPAYRPSGVDWLGDIPGHWRVLRLKHIADPQFSSVDKHTQEGELPVRLCNYTDVYYNEHITNNIEFMEATADVREIRRFTLRQGDVLITKDSESWDDIAVPALVSEPLDNVLCGYHLAQIRPREDSVLGAYLARAFASSGILDQFRVAATGVTRYGLPKSALADANFPIPPLDEQQSIARFLDEQTKKIDDLIEAKRELLALLKEKRQAVITHAVTNGLNPDVRLKPSGVDWLGDVPEHWRMTRLGRYTKWSSGEFISNDDYESEASGEHPIPVIGGNGVMGWTDRPLTEHETIVVGRVGALCGNVHFIQSPAWISDNALRLVWHKDFHLPFLSMLLEFLDINRFSAQTAQPLVTGSLLRSLEVPLPPEEEQRAIAAHLRDVLPPYESLQEEAEAAIGMLGELRSAVISAAVTGKIDVRGGAA
jgi:type I restriction enzyme S subunit